MEKRLILHPEVLAHPNIPKPLHGVNPRNIIGTVWWNTVRQEVYQRQNYRCIACGIHKEDARLRKWIECHEEYSIDFKKGIVVFKSLIGVCYFCHNFIHSGRMAHLVNQKKMKESLYDIIMDHGFYILKSFGNYNDWFHRNFGYIEKEINGKIILDPSWQEWKLVFDGQEYFSKFESYEDWQDYYS